ncbi:MAG: hypothetical protein R3C09_25065 [Pirellulaceae bacterium]
MILSKHNLRLNSANYARGQQAALLGGDGFSEDKIRLGVSALDNYLNQWKGTDVPGDAIASILAVLGKHDGFRELFEKYKDQRDWLTMRGMLLSNPLNPGQYEGYRFWITAAASDTVDATNIFGEPFKATLASNMESLFDGFGDGSFLQTVHHPTITNCFHIRLREIPVAKLTTDEKLQVLQNTLRAIREGIYRIQRDDLDEACSQIRNVNQLDIEIAQGLILESSAVLVETQLAGQQPRALRELFSRLYAVRQREKVVESTPTASASQRDAIRIEKTEIYKDLERLLTGDTEVRLYLIEMIRTRLSSQSYDRTSIPFELFQNADDAVIELASLACPDTELDNLRPQRQREQYVIETDSVDGRTVFRFIHWGRGINQFRSLSREIPDFQRDVERMLVLQGSGKHGESQHERTGGFGLGFKSVFLVCDEPVVFSGSRSRFRVLSGVYPASLGEEQAAVEARLASRLADLGDRNCCGTIIELQLREETDAQHLVERFRQCVGYLVVFSRAIRRCDLALSQADSKSYFWQPCKIDEGIELGEIQSSQGKHLALVFSCEKSTDKVLFALDGKRGIVSDFTKKLPCIWVTTPTKHKGRAGVIVNGAFDVNPGRTQLRETDANRKRAAAIGHWLGCSLVRLFDQASEDWESVWGANSVKDLSPDSFWTSLWDTCCQTLSASVDQLSDQIHRSILFGGSHAGMCRLIRDRDTLPTGLSGVYEGLTSLNKVKRRIEGILDVEEVWGKVCELEHFNKAFAPGTLIGGKTAKQLHAVNKSDWLELRPLKLQEFVDDLLPSSRTVPPDVASILGEVVGRSLWIELEKTGAHSVELEELREYFAGLLFKSGDGTWEQPSKLLCGQVHPEFRADETARSEFAPPERLLSREYDAPALTFFALCRRELDAPGRLLADWLLVASDPLSRAAGIRYLCEGALFKEMQNSLPEHDALPTYCWLRNRNEVVEAAVGLKDPQKAMLDNLLGFTTYQFRTVFIPSKVNKCEKDIFADLWKWWQDKREQILKTHDRAVYKNGVPPELTFGNLTSDASARRDWLRLFMRGAMYRIGRLTPQQARGFLDHFEDQGWLDQMVEQDDPQECFKILDGYLEQPSQRSVYYHYMNQFLAYYQLSRWLTRYARAFEAVTRVGVNLDNLKSIEDLTDLNRSHIFEGATGFEAPPCYVTMGKGAHFVLREVLRCRRRQLGQTYKPHVSLSQQAFVPSANVLRLMSEITGDGAWTQPHMGRSDYPHLSQKIFKKMGEHLNSEQAIFGGNYDIPLLVLTWSQFSDDRDDILGKVAHSIDGSAGLDFLTESEDYDD